MSTLTLHLYTTLFLFLLPLLLSMFFEKLNVNVHTKILKVVKFFTLFFVSSYFYPIVMRTADRKIFILKWKIQEHISIFDEQ